MSKLARTVPQLMTDAINIEINKAKQLPIGDGRTQAFTDKVYPLLDSAHRLGCSVELDVETGLYKLVKVLEEGEAFRWPTIGLRKLRALF